MISARPRKTGVKLQVIVIAGRNLVSKDDNGLSDPYVSLKLHTPGGLQLDNEGKGSTRYILETLNPVWCESFSFITDVADVLQVECYDKDTFGEEIMGTLTLPMNTLLKTIVAGGPSSMAWYPLVGPPEDASGEVHLGFTWQL